jgi:hypothetical protein
MAGLGKHIKGHGKEKIQGHKVDHHKAKDVSAGAQLSAMPMTSPIHPDLNSMAGGPSMPSATDAAQANINPMAGETQDMSAPQGLKKGGRAGYASGSKWIQKAIKHPGALRKSLHVKAGEKIPAKKLEAASHKPGKMGQRARLAKTLKGLR